MVGGPDKRRAAGAGVVERAWGPATSVPHALRARRLRQTIAKLDAVAHMPEIRALVDEARRACAPHGRPRAAPAAAREPARGPS